MTCKKKTWTEKLYDKKNFPKILKFERSFPCGKALEKWGAQPGDSVVIAPALDVLAIMNTIPKGKVITIYELCMQLAQKYKVNYCCSLTKGIFINIVAKATEEKQDKSLATPYWRTLKSGGMLNQKFPGGEEQQKRFLEKEGLSIIKKGKKFYLENYKQHLVT